MKHSLLDFFPTPMYLAPSSVGLDISDGSVKFVELSRRHGGAELGRYGERTLPEGALHDGIIQKLDEVEAVLSNLHAELGVRPVTVSIMQEQGYLLRLKVLVQNEIEIREGIELQLEEHIPLAPAEALFDYSIISHPHAGAEFFEVSVCVFPRDLVEAYMKLLRSSGFEPVALEIESQSIARAVIPALQHSSSLVIDFGRERTGIVIVSEGIAAFSSSIAVGGESFTRILEKELNLSKEKAEELKKEKGISRSAGSDNLFSFFVPLLSVLKEEVEKRYAYWHTHPYESEVERGKIESIILSGRSSNLRGLPEYLSSNLGVKVALANPWCNSSSFARNVPRMPLGEALGYAAAIGLAERAYGAHDSYTIPL